MGKRQLHEMLGFIHKIHSRKFKRVLLVDFRAYRSPPHHCPNSFATIIEKFKADYSARRSRLEVMAFFYPLVHIRIVKLF